MCSQELSVIYERNLPVKVIIVNNEALGMVRQWQESFYEKRYSESLLGTNPDFVKLAESHGVRGIRIDKEEDTTMVLKEAFAYDGPVDRKSTRLNSSHVAISYAVFCLKKKQKSVN